MGSLSFGELFLIIIVAAIIFGPNQLPELAKKLGQLVKDFKNVVNRIDSDIKDEVNSIKKSVDLSEMDETLNELRDVTGNFSEISKSVNHLKAINPMKHPLQSVKIASDFNGKLSKQEINTEQVSPIDEIREVSVNE